MLVRRRTFGSNLSFMGAVYSSLTFSRINCTVNGRVELHRGGRRIEDQSRLHRLGRLCGSGCGGR